VKDNRKFNLERKRMERKVDIWLGLCFFKSRKLEGYLIDSSEETKYSTIKVTDKEYLDEITFANNEDYTYDWATKLPQDRVVYYGSFCWTEIGEIKDEELVNNKLKAIGYNILRTKNY
jgi:hypothetical protein